LFDKSKLFLLMKLNECEGEENVLLIILPPTSLSSSLCNSFVSGKYLRGELVCAEFDPLQKGGKRGRSRIVVNFA